jgi:hypothetical protein
MTGMSKTAVDLLVESAAKSPPPKLPKPPRSATRNGYTKDRTIVLYLESVKKQAYQANVERIGWKVSDWARVVLEAIILVNPSCWPSFLDILYLIVRLDGNGLRDLKAFLLETNKELFLDHPGFPHHSQFVKTPQKRPKKVGD